MNCKTARDTMMLALYGETKEPEGRDLGAHLAGCGRCAREAARLTGAARTIE